MKRLLLVFCVLAILLSMVSCEKSITPKNRIFDRYFDTVSTLYDYTGLSRAEFDKMALDIEEKISKYHKYFDIYNEYEGIVNLAYINKTVGKIKIDKELFDFLKFSKEIHSLTGGEVNVAFGAVLSIWHSYREAGEQVPDIALLEEANLHTDINSLALYEDELAVERLDERLLIDAGAIGKGYACEVIGEYVREKYGEGFVLDFGGNLKAIGSKPNGDAWKSGVKNPIAHSSQSHVYTFELKNQSVATSGNYERFYQVDGLRYHHIIDKDTLMPKNEYASVTVISDSGAYADALSTAFFNMSKEEIENSLKAFKNTSVVLVYPDGKSEILK